MSGKSSSDDIIWNRHSLLDSYEMVGIITHAQTIISQCLQHFTVSLLQLANRITSGDLHKDQFRLTLSISFQTYLGTVLRYSDDPLAG